MNTNMLYAFLGGALVGAGTALLLAPEKGSDVRACLCTKGNELTQRVKELLRRKGLMASDSEVDALVEQLTTELDD